jgi:hypothetical protein
MKRIAGLIVSIFLVFVFTSGVALSQMPGSASVAKRKEEATKKRMIYLTRDEILAGAKKEGKVVTASGIPGDYARSAGSGIPKETSLYHQR